MGMKGDGCKAPGTGLVQATPNKGQHSILADSDLCVFWATHLMPPHTLLPPSSSDDTFKPLIVHITRGAFSPCMLLFPFKCWVLGINEVLIFLLLPVVTVLRQQYHHLNNKSSHLLNAYYIPGTGGWFTRITSLKITLELGTVIALLYRQATGISGRLSNWAQVTQPMDNIHPWWNFHESEAKMRKKKEH